MFLHQIFLSTLCTLCMLTTYCQDNWILAKQKNGISVYTKNLDSSKFKAIKVEAMLSGKLSRFDSIIRDVTNHQKWIYSTKNTHLVKLISNNEIIYYAETVLPWPFANRDVVIDMTIHKDTNRHAIIVHTKNVNNVLPANSGVVRIPLLQTDWDVQESSSDSLHIIYYFITDPGGSLAPWLVNSFAVKGPYETFSNLAAFLKTQ